MSVNALVQESHGHWVAVELASVGGDGGLDHADGTEYIGHEHEGETDAAGQESEWD